MSSLDLTVRDCTDSDLPRPVTGGVPIAEGAAPAGVIFHLADERGESVPVQAQVIGRWGDGSARWVLLDFVATPPAGSAQRCRLTWGDRPAAAPPVPCAAVDPAPTLVCGDLTLAPGEDCLLRVGESLGVDLRLILADGSRCAMRVTSAEVEAPGPMRATVQLRGDFTRPNGERVFTARLRVSIYAGLRKIRLEPLIIVDAAAGVIQRLRGLYLDLRARGADLRARIGGEPGWEGPAEADVRLLQVDDQSYRFEGAQGTGAKAPGWAEIAIGDDRIAVAVRSFWQQWPKSLEASADGLSVGLFPTFTVGDFDHMQPWWKYQYLFEDATYRLRTGQARRWEVWLDLEGDGAALAAMADAPAVPIADPAQAIATGVWGEIMPAGAPGMVEYDGWAEHLFRAFARSIEQQRDYGAMNWGDWFGERVVNWGNHEYDTTNQLLIQFARTGDPRYFYAADAAARHCTEVDTVHFVNDALWDHFCETSGGPKRGEQGQEPAYPYRAGMVHQHTVGHVTGFFSVDAIRQLFIDKGVGRPPRPYLCLDPTNLGHIWTQGSSRHYFLTGDPFIRDTVLMIGDNLARLVEDGRYAFMGHNHCGRVAGWTMLALAGAYEIDLEERYLAAMRAIAEEAIADQDPNCGGWLYELSSGHCDCRTKHVGMAGFITAVLVNGLSRYYGLSHDEKVAEVIDRGVTFLDLDTWHDHRRGWRYTSCPATGLRGVSQPGVTMMAHVNA
ncbi:MAG: hypothetical protein AB7Y46_07955, partial [Armatimonadota bacterium]